MPEPRKGENKKDFIKRCIPYIIREGKNNAEAVAICYSIWERSKKETNSMENERVLLHLCTPMFKPMDLKEDERQHEIDFYRATILVGDGTYNGIYFPREELQRAFMSWDRQPINLDHSDRVEDIVGYIKDVAYDLKNSKITVQPVIADYLPKSVVAKGYIASRLEAGAIPEVSVGVWVDREYEEDENGNERLTARNLQGDHLALVTRGACSPKDGCGIGLNQNEPINDTFTFSIEYNEDDEKERLMKELLKEKIKKEELYD